MTMLKRLPESASVLPARIDAMNRLARELLNTHPARAMTVAEQARSLAMECGYQGGIMTALYTLGHANAVIYARHDLAEAQLNESLSLARTIHNRGAEAHALNALGTLYWRLADRARATAAFSEALTIAGTIGNRAQELAALNGLGHIASGIGLTSQAEEYYAEMLRIARETGMQKEEAAALNGLGGVYEYQGDLTRSFDFRFQALRIAEAIDYRQLVAYASGNIANIYQRLGDNHRALHYELASLRIKQDLGDRWGEGISYNNIGIIYKSIGDYANALEAYLKSLQITEEIGDRRGEAVALNNIGVIYEALGDSTNVLDYYIRSLQISQQLSDKWGESSSLSHIGRYYEGQREYSRALIHHFKSLKIQHETGDRYGEWNTLNNIGSIYFQVDEMEKATEYFTKGLGVAEEMGDKEGRVTTLLNLGGLHHHTGNHREAAELLHEALKMAEEMGHKSLAGQGLDSLAALYTTLGDRQASAAFERMSIELNRELFNDEMKARVRKLIDGFERRNARREAQLLGLEQKDLLEMNEALLKMSRMKTEQMLERAAPPSHLREEPDRTAGTRIDVRTFGEFGVTINGRELRKGDWQRKRARDLFKLLLLHHKTAVTIDEMVETLWGGVSQRNVELLVMNAISHIRKALDPDREPHKQSPFLTSSDRTYTLDLGEGAQIDFLRFRELVADARRSPGTERKRSLYQEAVGIYQGEFLKEDLYESWTADTRDRLRDMLAEALSYLAGEHLRNGDLDEAITMARRVIAFDPVSEHAYEILLEALRNKRRTADLLKAFNECARAFESELGVEPPERLRRLATPL